MYCQSCGAQTSDVAVACLKCGFVAPIATSAAARDISGQVKVSSRDALDVLKRLAADPVGGLAAAYAGLGQDRALRAGVAMWIVFALVGAAGLVMGANQLQRWAFGSMGAFGGGFGGSQGLGAFFRAAFQLLILPAAITVAALALRKMSGAKPAAAADVFTAGASVAPLGAALLLAGLIGGGNFEIVLLLLFFALAYLVLMLYAGLTTVGEMPPRAAAPAVPATILLAGWLCKVVIAALV